MDITLLIIKNKQKLEQMILDGEDYKRILKQSKKLDKYINIKMHEFIKQKK